MVSLMSRMQVTAIALLTVMSLIACGADSGPDGEASLGRFGGEMEEALCAAKVECRWYPDMQTCLDATFFDMGQILASEADGRVKYHADQTSECLAVIASALRCDRFAEVDEDDIDEACEGVFTGTVELGGECYDGEECIGGSSCDLPCDSDQCCAGTCVADEIEPEPVAIGEDCSAAACVKGAYCGEDPVICIAVGNEGDLCPSHGLEYCAEGLYCGGPEFGTTTCYRPGAEGERCNPTHNAMACARSDLWCDAADNTCKAALDVGEECDLQVPNCAGYAWCEGRCLAQPGAGDSCQVGLSCCLGDLVCSGGRCSAPEADQVCGPDSPG